MRMDLLMQHGDIFTDDLKGMLCTFVQQEHGWFYGQPMRVFIQPREQRHLVIPFETESGMLVEVLDGDDSGELMTT